jgi:type I restriction enzyme R subunit
MFLSGNKEIQEDGCIGVSMSNYDEIIKLPQYYTKEKGIVVDPSPVAVGYENPDGDKLVVMEETIIGLNGMKIDRMFFDQFGDKVKKDDFIRENIAIGQWEKVIEYMNENILNKPEEFYTIEKLRRAAGVDRRISMREILENIYGMIPYFKSKDKLLDEEFEKFIIDRKPDNPSHIVAMKYFFKAYTTDSKVRDIIDNKRYTDLNVNPNFTMKDYKAIPKNWREIIPEYIKDYISLNQFM